MKKYRILTLLLACLLLYGCQGTAVTSGSEGGQTDSGQVSSTITVYAKEEYRYALQQVFSHIHMSDGSMEILWSGDKDTADVVITDCVPQSQYGDYLVLDREKLETQALESLLLTSSQGVIGLPMFLHLDGFWYDKLLYSNQHAQVPQSADTWFQSPLTREYPAVCGPESMEALFWGVVAPLYISNGGSAEQLASGQLQIEYLQAALEQIEKMLQQEALILTEDARQRFTSVEAAFWVAGVEQVARFYNFKSNLSAWDISLSVPFEADKKAQAVIRADMLLVRKTADPAVAERFLQLFYTEKMLSDLSEDTRMPMACRMNYAPGVVPELAKICYTALASPATELCYLVCGWGQQKTEMVESCLLDMLSGEIDAEQATMLISEER